MEQSPPTARSILESDPSQRNGDYMEIVFMLVIPFNGEHAPLNEMSKRWEREE